MIAAELREVPYVKGTQILVIRNYGESVARDVRVSFDPDLPGPEDSTGQMTSFLKRRYSQPIPVLTPGMELDNIYFSGRQSGGSWVNTEPTPPQVTVMLEYTNDAGESFGPDMFSLDTDLLRTRTYAESSGAPEKQLKRAAKAIEKIARRLDKSPE